MEYTVIDKPVYDREYKLLAKRLNQRMVEAEKRDMNSPGIKAMKSALDTLGRKRFSETGKASSQEELDFMKAQLKRFEDMETTTVSGYKEYREDVLETAREKYDLDELGISDDEYLDIWEALPDIKKDRLYDSNQYIAVMRALVRKQNGNETEDSDGIDIKALIGDFENYVGKEGETEEQRYKNALKSIGLTRRDVNRELRMMKNYD